MAGKIASVGHLAIYLSFAGWMHRCRKWIKGTYPLAFKIASMLIMQFITYHSQVIKNYRYQDAESLSFSFLTVWLSGKNQKDKDNGKQIA